MRFELFDGIRAVGMVAWEPGRVILDIPDPATRALLVRSFEGWPTDAERGRIVLTREGWDANDFEAACAGLLEEHGLTAIPRPWSPPGPR